MIKEKRVKVAVFQCVYCKDNPIWFEQSIQSIINQDYGFSNINYYLCVDGPVSEDLQRIIEKYSKNITTIP